METIRVSEWLCELHSHSILDCEAARKDFEKETGKTAPWGKGYTHEEMARQIEARGKGGSLSNTDKRLIGALEVARSCYKEFAGDEKAERKFGMGFQYREYVHAIQRAEKKR